MNHHTITEKHLRLEKHSIITKFVRLFFVPTLNSLPASFIKQLMRKSSHDAATVVERGGSTHALEAMYTRYHRGLFDRGFFQGIADIFWHHIVSQPKALRNRLKIVESILETELKTRLPNTKTLTVLNLGGGSSRGIIHTLDRLSRNNYTVSSVNITNVDKHIQAIELGQEIARRFHLENNFQWINDTVQNLSNLVIPESADIIEMVGLLDYFSEEKGVAMFQQIYKALKVDGLFIVANVHPNSEMTFVRKADWPHMHYRRQEDIAKMLRVGGFTKVPEIVLEPLKVHIIASVRK